MRNGEIQNLLSLHGVCQYFLFPIIFSDLDCICRLCQVESVHQSFLCIEDNLVLSSILQESHSRSPKQSGVLIPKVYYNTHLSSQSHQVESVKNLNVKSQLLKLNP